MKRYIIFAFAFFTLMLSNTHAAPNAGTWTSSSVSNAYGKRNYKLWTPGGYNNKTALPLVLMLHGCTQNPDDFAAGTRMNEVADEYNFLVAYPEQPASANALRCWNWFEPAHQARGAGEPSLLAEVVRDVRRTRKVDELRIFVAGISAGGVLANTLAVAYPELFAAVGVCAGLEYKAASNIATALVAQNGGAPDPQQQGALAYQAMLAASVETTDANRARTLRAPRRLTRVIVFHGANDSAVRPVNANQIITQWAQTNDLLHTAKDDNSVTDTPAATMNGTITNGYDYTREIYHDPAGKPLMEKWIVKDLRHAWSGGAAAGSYTDAKGPDASREIWRFFSETPRASFIKSSANKPLSSKSSITKSSPRIH